MNWKVLFIVGVVLSASPFKITFPNYELYYSLFGFGLVLISLLFKKMDRLDAFIFADLAVSILLGIANIFDWYLVFQIFFFILILIRVYLNTTDKLLERLAFFGLFLVPVYLTLYLFNLFGAFMLVFLMDGWYYLNFILCTVLLVAAYKEL